MSVRVNALRFVALAGSAALLVGCQSFREATGVAKLAPDEFTVLTKAPLIIPPDYNLRPPQPGAPDRNVGTPAEQARQALFTQNPQAEANALGAGFSDGERALLAKSGGSVADPTIRQAISADSGIADQGAGFANRVLFPQAGGAVPAAAPATTPAAPAAAAPAASAAPVVRGTTQ